MPVTIQDSSEIAPTCAMLAGSMMIPDPIMLTATIMVSWTRLIFFASLEVFIGWSLRLRTDSRTCGGKSQIHDECIRCAWHSCPKCSKTPAAASIGPSGHRSKVPWKSASLVGSWPD
jgi:hypothetical protein